MAEPFYLFTRRRGGNFYVQFRMDDGTITAPKSTGTPNKKEAQLTAMRWLSSGEIPERVNSKDKSSKTKSLDLLEWMNYLKTYEFEHDDVQKIVDILVKRKMLVSGIVTASKESRPVVPYLLEFWNYDVSPYRKERSTLGKELSYTYFETALGRIKKYWAPRLEGRYIGDITPDDIAAIYSDPAIEGLASKTVKDIVNIMVIAMQWAHRKHLTKVSDFDDIPKVTVKPSNKKDILRPDTITKVFEAPWENDMNRLANLLAMYTGMRASEVQALRVCDIFDKYIWVSHAWDDKLGLKCPKNGEERPVPISADLRQALLTMASFNPRAAKDKENTFVFYGITGEKPVSQRGFNKYLHRALEYIGYPEPNKIGFHCWRHGFCTETRTVIHDDRIIREVSGHKSQQMFEHYSDHLEMKETIEIMGNAAEQLFGDIVSKTLRTPVLEAS